LDIAREKEDKEATNQILAIIERERDKSFWRRMSYSLGKSRGGACSRSRSSRPMAQFRGVLRPRQPQRGYLVEYP
jgi:hypothetical protein